MSTQTQPTYTGRQVAGIVIAWLALFALLLLPLSFFFGKSQAEAHQHSIQWGVLVEKVYHPPLEYKTYQVRKVNGGRKLVELHEWTEPEYVLVLMDSTGRYWNLEVGPTQFVNTAYLDTVYVQSP